MEPEDNLDREEGSQFPAAFAAGVVIVLLLGVGLIFLSRTSQPHGPAAAPKLPFGMQEQAYAQQIHFQDIQMAHSTNFLNQEFTFIAGTLANGGNRTIGALEVEIVFRDPFNQVILRDTERLIGSAAQPLGGGQQRDFQVVLERLPPDWNRQYPSIRATGLILQ